MLKSLSTAHHGVLSSALKWTLTPVIGCQDVVDYHKKLFAKMS